MSASVTCLYASSSDEFINYSLTVSADESIDVSGVIMVVAASLMYDW